MFSRPEMVTERDGKEAQEMMGIPSLAGLFRICYLSFKRWRREKWPS